MFFLRRKARRSWRNYLWVEHRGKNAVLRVFTKNIIVGEGFSHNTIELLSALVLASHNITGCRVAVCYGEPYGVVELVKKHIGIDIDCSRHVVVDGNESSIERLVSSVFRRYAYVCSSEGDRVVVGIAYRP